MESHKKEEQVSLLRPGEKRYKCWAVVVVSMLLSFGAAVWSVVYSGGILWGECSTIEDIDTGTNMQVYFERIYGTHHNVTADKIGFLYNDAPCNYFRNIAIHKFTRVSEGFAYDYVHPFSSFAPEHVISKVGYFIHRHKTESDFRPGTLIEVMRVDAEPLHEAEVAWFWHATGSGIFMQVPTDVLVVRTYEQFAQEYGQKIRHASHQLLRLANTTMLVIMEGFYPTSRTEVIVWYTGEPPGVCAPHIPMWSANGDKCDCSEKYIHLNC